MEILLVILIIFLITSYNGKTKSRISALEKAVHELQERTPLIPHTFDNEYAVPQSKPLTQPQQNVVSHTPSSGTMMYPGGVPSLDTEDPLNEFVVWLKKDLLMKIGALFLLIGVGWFVSYAFMNDWIGEAGRITFGILIGAIILVLGYVRIKTHEHQGAVFTVLGAGTIMMTVYAARAMYDFFTPPLALFFMFFTVLFVTFVSLRYRRNSLALAGLIMACIAPYFTASNEPQVFEQFMYLFVVVSGTLWIVYHTGWRNLTLTALIFVFLETLPYAALRGTDSMMVLLWVFLFVAIFFIANVISILRVQGAQLSAPHLLTALGTALFLIFWVFGVAPTELQSLLFVAWMLVFSFGAYIVYRSTSERIPFYVYGGTSIALLAAATTAELEGAVLTIAYIFEIAVLVALANGLRLKQYVVASLSWLFSVPVLLSVQNVVSSAWNRGVIHEDFFVLLILALVLGIIGSFMYERGREDSASTGIDTGHGVALIFMGALYGLILVWLISHALFTDGLGTLLSLVIYTVLGIYLYIRGHAIGNKRLSTMGWVLIGFVVLWALVVVSASASVFVKVITFAIVGILLLSTAFMGKRARKDHEI